MLKSREVSQKGVLISPDLYFWVAAVKVPGEKDVQKGGRGLVRAKGGQG